MKAIDVMTARHGAVAPDAPVEEIAMLLLERRIVIGADGAWQASSARAISCAGANRAPNPVAVLSAQQLDAARIAAETVAGNAGKVHSKLSVLTGHARAAMWAVEPERSNGDAKSDFTSALFATVIQGLAGGGLAEEVRVILDKPFGRDLASARALNRAARSVFPEDENFRIDHLLGKEAITAILCFRFANSFLAPA